MERFPSLFDPLTGRGLLWVTAAEGFFFISGALVGIVRGRKMHAASLRAATKDLWKRAGKLYAASVILTLGFTGLGYWLDGTGLAGVKGGLTHFGSVWGLLWQTLTLQYAYGWADFLNYYVVFLLLSPVALWLCRRRLWWVVLAVSLCLWVAKLFLGGAVLDAYLTWQVYFFGGVVFGYHYGDIHAWYRSLSEAVRRWGRVAVFAGTAVTVVASFVLTFGTPVLGQLQGDQAPLTDLVRTIKDNWWFTMLLQDNRAGLLRVLLFMGWFGTLFALVRRYEDAIIRRVGWLLLPLGKNSLYVYILQAILVVVVGMANIPQEFAINTLINMAAIMVYWWAVRKRWLFTVIPR